MDLQSDLFDDVRWFQIEPVDELNLLSSSQALEKFFTPLEHDVHALVILESHELWDHVRSDKGNDILPYTST